MSEVLFLRRLILASWDEVAPETRTQLERPQKWSSIITGRIVRRRGKNEGSG